MSKQWCRKLPLVGPDDTIRRAMEVINEVYRGIALAVDANGLLLGTVTDGDTRRAILAGVSLDRPVSELLSRKAEPQYAKPAFANIGVDDAHLLRMMEERRVRQLPLLDEQGRVIDLVTMDDLLPASVLPLQAVIMAGGAGTRLRPLTESSPKPMLPVGDRPLMERTIEMFRKAGIRRVNVTTHYQAEKITSHFRDGGDFGVDIRYVTEDQPLGTAGSLGLLEKSDQPLLVMNGDILTKLDVRAMLDFHREQGADLTVGVRQYDLSVPFGVVETRGPLVSDVVEKPLLKFLVNAGIYLLEPDVPGLISAGERIDMTDLIRRLLGKGKRVASFPIVEYWIDVGRMDDYQRAQQGTEGAG